MVNMRNLMLQDPLTERDLILTVISLVNQVSYTVKTSMIIYNSIVHNSFSDVVTGKIITTYGRSVRPRR